MAKWTGVITNAGNSLLNAWIGEKTLRFDCAKAGTGTVEIAALMAQTDLVSQKQDASILSAESVDGGIRLKLRVTASQEGYLLNQFGVWASVDGNTALIAIYQHESGVSVPSMDDSPDFVFTFYALIMTSNTGTWTVNIDTSALVTQDDLNIAIAEAKSYADKIADNAVAMKLAVLTLTAAGWSNGSQTVAADGVMADDTMTAVITTAAADSVDAYLDSGIKCAGEGDGTLTFTCTTEPSEDLRINLIVLKKGGWAE